MKSIQVCLNSIEKVKGFVNDVSKFDNNFELISGRYIVDAKSIMGIFALNLAQPICLHIHAEENMDQIMNVLMGYLV